ncbi:MAG TPA: DUF1573 domain-containing protein [Blastocatellia bacterium]|nr:DUF1573 domain-containing protein [Blastocatellia bacterium]
MKLKVAITALLLLTLGVAVLAGMRLRARAKQPRLAVETFEHDFGTLRPGAVMSHTFPVRNEGKTDLEIRSVWSHCGCTASSFDKVIAPGRVGGITLTVRDTESYQGRVMKFADVLTNDPDHARFSLALRATFAEQ